MNKLGKITALMTQGLYLACAIGLIGVALFAKEGNAMHFVFGLGCLLLFGHFRVEYLQKLKSK